MRHDTIYGWQSDEGDVKTELSKYFNFQRVALTVILQLGVEFLFA